MIEFKGLIFYPCYLDLLDLLDHLLTNLGKRKPGEGENIPPTEQKDNPKSQIENHLSQKIKPDTQSKTLKNKALDGVWMMPTVDWKDTPQSKIKKMSSQKTKSSGKSNMLNNKAIAMLAKAAKPNDKSTKGYNNKSTDEDDLFPSMERKNVPIAHNEKSSTEAKFDLSNLKNAKACEYHNESMHILWHISYGNK